MAYHTVTGCESVSMGWAFKPDFLVEWNSTTFESLRTDNFDYYREHCQGTISVADQALVASLELLGGSALDEGDELMKLTPAADPISRMIPGEANFARQGSIYTSIFSCDIVAHRLSRCFPEFESRLGPNFEEFQISGCILYLQFSYANRQSALQ